MTNPVPRDTLERVKKLALLPEEAKHSRWSLSVTRLRVLERLCQQHDVADRFVISLARLTRQRVEEKAKETGFLVMEEWARHRKMIDRVVTALEVHLKEPSEEDRSRLWTLFHELVGEQNEYRSIHGGPVRIIENNDLLLAEYALRTVLADEGSLPQWAYQTARHYCERYTPTEGTGLTIRSAPLLQDIADFWLREFDLELTALLAPSKEKKVKKSSETKSKKGEDTPENDKTFTHRQGQFLAFLHLYRKLHRQGPAETDLSRYFRVTPPAVHLMIVKLEELGLITREPGVARSARVILPEEQIPRLEDVAGPPW